MRLVMRYSMIGAMLLPILSPATAGEIPRPPEPHLYVLHLTEEGFHLKPLRLGDGESKSFTIDAESDVVDVIFPVSEGQSGNIVQRSSNRYTVTVGRDGDTYVSSTRASTGRGRDLPSIEIADLGEYRIRVNATAADGRKAAFVIDRGVEARRDTGGRVIDMFRGMVPMSPGDVSITTEIEKPQELPVVHGEAELIYDAGLLFTTIGVAGGAPREFIVDFAAGGTVLDKASLPPDTEIRPLVAIEYSADGPKQTRGQMQGAGGEVHGFLGRAIVPELTVGDMVFRDVEVSVLSSMPQFGGHAPSGILGMDLLTRAEVVCVSYAGNERPGHLRLADTSHVSAGKSVEIPFNRAGNHLFVEGRVEQAPVTFVFDTGARRAHIHPAVASAAGLTLRADDNPNGTRGLDGKKMDTRLAASKHLHLGGSAFRDVPFVVADLPVFQTIGLGDAAGLLGNTFLDRYSEIEVDFRRGVLRLVD
jgi:predicted aspartyl protease